MGLRRDQRDDPCRHQRERPTDQGARPFRPQRVWLHAQSRDWSAAGRGKIRSEGQLGDQGRHADRPAAGGCGICPRLSRRRQKLQADLPGCPRFERPAAGGVLAKNRAVLRADQPRLHGLRALQGVVHRRPALCRGDIIDVSAAGKIIWSDPEPFSVWSGALATAGDIVFYGTLEGYLKAVDMQTGKELYRFKTPSGIIGNVNTFTHGGKQYIGVLSGVGGWAGIGMAAGLTKDTDGLGAVGAYKALANYTQLGGVLTVFGLPE